MNQSASLGIRALAASAMVSLMVGCGQGLTSEQTGTSEQGVLGDEKSPGTQNAIVEILSPNRWDTGFLVAPTLVLTARSAVSELSEGAPAYWRCDTAAPVTAALAASRIRVMVGPAAGPKFVAHSVERTFVGPGLDFCDDPLALLRLDAPIDDIAPMQVRLDTPTAVNETGTLIGWGESTVLPEANSGVQRFQAQLTIGSVSGSTFITEQGGCYGDNGAPFVSARTGAVAGVMIRFNPTDAALDAGSLRQNFSDCADASTVFQSLLSQRDWLRRAFADAHEAPWLEGTEPRPTTLGETCAADSDCISGFCATAGSARFCSASCDSSPCPTNMQCLGTTGMKLCVPNQVPSEPARSASCEVAWCHETSSAWTTLFVLAFVVSRRRKRRRELPCDPPNPTFEREETSHEIQ